MTGPCSRPTGCTSATSRLGRTGRNLVIIDTPEAMRAELSLPDTTYGRDVATEIRGGLLTGMSLEFRATKDDVVGTHRVIETARMGGFGVVDDPAYPGSGAEMRELGRVPDGAWAPCAGGSRCRTSTMVTRLSCACGRPLCHGCRRRPPRSTVSRWSRRLRLWYWLCSCGVRNALRRFCRWSAEADYHG